MLEHHKAPVIRIKELIKHPNADQLSLVLIGGFQVVVRTENYKLNDLAVYIYPDSVVPELPPFSFVWERDGAGNERKITGAVPAEYRRVTVRRFRKQISEGLLIPYHELERYFQELTKVGTALPKEGDDVAEMLGITHYEPQEDADVTGENEVGPGKGFRFPRTWKGWVWLIKGIFGIRPLSEHETGVDRPTYDVENYKNFVGAIRPGETVMVTEKLHGSNARYTFENGKMFAGSRNLWKSASATSSIWRKILEANPEFQEWCEEHPGFTLYGEAIPTQKGYNYGAVVPQCHIFDVRTPDGRWIEYASKEFEALDTDGFLSYFWVPLLYIGPFDEAKIKALADGPSVLSAETVREGVVVRPVKNVEGWERGIRGLGRIQLKLVSNKFLEKDSQ